uniref:Uncharacterized protein n=1 Tax=Chromera velia CCMP2878 TaxID=1169474 RepID=A0A0G4GUZ2_9ALVE|eukprot:Cvel_23501.t1-p1 / transcript=Cvel_23501.t1 / gene=Cvel_23501 / organism=Chromera_velia_CCMP2878 / gene_product=Basic proline-rich protein, putative / transcript_product=Basic proline-rich protein, putative / location=Cvel_scaffold2428:11045-24697(+) / protein_length=2181 / sequence_SO=supercontig / SO=protein_coding / is_pseudo=false
MAPKKNGVVPEQNLPDFLHQAIKVLEQRGIIIPAAQANSPLNMNQLQEVFAEVLKESLPNVVEKKPKKAVPNNVKDKTDKCQNFLVKAKCFRHYIDHSQEQEDVFGNKVDTAYQLYYCTGCKAKVKFYNFADLLTSNPAWLEAHFTLCPHWSEARKKYKTWAEKTVKDWAEKKIEDSKRGNAVGKTQGDKDRDVVETLFEFYDISRKLHFLEGLINEMLIPEPFLAQLDNFPPGCLIQLIDFHGSSFREVDEMVDMCLKALKVYGKNGANMFAPCLGYVESRKALAKGYKLDPNASRYNYANRAVIYTTKILDKTHKIIFRVCPHIMQSQIATAIVYCASPEGSKKNANKNWEDRLFRDPAAFGEALVRSHNMLAEGMQEEGGERPTVTPKWTRNVFLAYKDDTPQEEIDRDCDSLKMHARPETEVKHLPIPTTPKKKARVDAQPAAAAAAGGGGGMPVLIPAAAAPAAAAAAAARAAGYQGNLDDDDEEENDLYQDPHGLPLFMLNAPPSPVGPGEWQDGVQGMDGIAPPLAVGPGEWQDGVQGMDGIAPPLAVGPGEWQDGVQGMDGIAPPLAVGPGEWQDGVQGMDGIAPPLAVGPGEWQDGVQGMDGIAPPLAVGPGEWQDGVQGMDGIAPPLAVGPGEWQDGVQGMDGIAPPLAVGPGEWQDGVQGMDGIAPPLAVGPGEWQDGVQGMDGIAPPLAVGPGEWQDGVQGMDGIAPPLAVGPGEWQDGVQGMDGIAPPLAVGPGEWQDGVQGMDGIAPPLAVGPGEWQDGVQGMDGIAPPLAVGPGEWQDGVQGMDGIAPPLAVGPGEWQDGVQGMDGIAPPLAVGPGEWQDGVQGMDGIAPPLAVGPGEWQDGVQGMDGIAPPLAVGPGEWQDGVQGMDGIAPPLAVGPGEWQDGVQGMDGIAPPLAVGPGEWQDGVQGMDGIAPPLAVGPGEWQDGVQGMDGIAPPLAVGPGEWQDGVQGMDGIAPPLAVGPGEWQDGVQGMDGIAPPLAVGPGEWQDGVQGMDGIAPPLAVGPGEWQDGVQGMDGIAPPLAVGPGEWQDGVQGMDGIAPPLAVGPGEWQDGVQGMDGIAPPLAVGPGEWQDGVQGMDGIAPPLAVGPGEWQDGVQGMDGIAPPLAVGPGEWQDGVQGMDGIAPPLAVGPGEWQDGVQGEWQDGVQGMDGIAPPLAVGPGEWQDGVQGMDGIAPPLAVGPGEWQDGVQGMDGIAPPLAVGPGEWQNGVQGMDGIAPPLAVGPGEWQDGVQGMDLDVGDSEREGVPDHAEEGSEIPVDPENGEETEGEPDLSDLRERLQTMVNDSEWISFRAQGEPPGASVPVTGRDLGNFIRLCFAGFRSRTSDAMAETRRAHSALLRSHLTINSIVEWPEGPAEQSDEAMGGEGASGGLQIPQSEPFVNGRGRGASAARGAGTRQNRKLGKNPVTPPRSIDLSGTRGLSPEKIFLFLDSLPPSVEEMKLDSVAVKGRALPLLLRYLERLQAARTEGRQAPRLRSFTFAGNPLGHEGIRAVAEGVREGKAASLRVLDLEKTGLEKEGLKSLCGALKETSLPVETLNCSGNTIGFKRTPGDSFFLQHIFSRVEYGVEEMQRLSSVLCLSSLPFVRQLLLRECGLTDMAVEPLTESIAKKKLPNLEMLDLGGNDFGGRFLGFFEKALRADAVPCLKGLNIENARNRAPESKEPVSAFLKALSAPECPPQLQVSGLRLCPLDLNEQEVRALDTNIGLFADAVRVGNLPGLRSLEMRGACIEEDFGQVGMDALKGAVVESEEGLPLLENLNLRETRAGEGAAFLGTALMSGKMARLSNINLCDSDLTNAGLVGLGDAVRGGGLVSVVSLNLSWNSGVEREAWGAFMRAVAESEMGMPELESLSVYETEANRAGGPVAVALGSGKLPSLSGRGMSVETFFFDGAGVGELGEALRAGRFPASFPNITFKLSQPDVNLDEQIRAIAESERGMPLCVAGLVLSGGRLSEEALASLAASGGGASGSRLLHLQTLDLSSCGIDDARLGRLWEVFSTHECRELESLNLEDNPISVEGVSAFLEAIAQSERGVPKLNSLNLSNTDAHFAGGPVAVVLASGKLPFLKTLGAESFSLDEAGVGDLEEAIWKGEWPEAFLKPISFKLTQANIDQSINVDRLIRAIVMSERGLPWCVEKLDFNGGRLSERALSLLAQSERGALRDKLSNLSA